MSTSLSVINPLEGELLLSAVLGADDMCSMNFAREECYKLSAILLGKVIPAMGGYSNELACDIARHLEQIQTFSGNFCWRHRHLGASFGVVGKRPGIDVEVRP
ncbi:hypothetical protein [Pseudomonas trivialis]|uniref:Uncharacterized protein n=1 Tax=Pseudomonas trivialis TaxID=200450 RepID=A0A0H5A7P7_9PSED|nr:hypothetical protein [Pseudomonas trivialis]AKS06956.1 hypothetical protein AA957_12805 [Pseudomonas trivialis]